MRAGAWWWMLDTFINSFQESGVSVILSYASRVSGADAGIGCVPRLVKNRLPSFVSVVAAFALVLLWAPRDCLGDETNSPSPATSSIEDTNSQVLLRAFLQLPEQLRATQLA